MPGITGILAKAGVDPAEVERMTRVMAHEPSYVSGTYANSDMGLCAGWVGHAGPVADGMPIWNERRDACLIFAGESFMSEAELRRCGVREGDIAQDRAKGVMALYEAMGPAFIDKLNGWFSGLLIDLRRNVAVLFNDRYGLGRVYVHEGQDRLYFSSEAKSLLAVLPAVRRLDMRGVAETFSCGCVLQDRTLFSGISLLPGGSRWSFPARGPVAKERYFTPDAWERQPGLGDAEFYDRLRETFPAILPKYLGGPEPVAMSLTGGLDGRMIMAWAKPEPATLPCYTFDGPYRTCADTRIARRIAKLCEQPHRTIPVGADFLAEFPSLAEKAVFVSDGTMDVTGAVELYTNRAAREIAPVRLTGNYGSEIVRGNVAFRPGNVPDGLLAPEFARAVRDAAATYREERNGHPVSFIAFKQVPWHHYARLSIEQSQLRPRSPYLDNELVALMYRAPTELLASKEPSLRLIHEGNPALATLPTDRGVAYGDFPLVGKLRQASAEFGVKAEYAYDYGMPQWLARIDHRLAPLHLERLFLGRQKFAHFRVWYRDELAAYLREVLLDRRARHRDYLEPQTLERMVVAHTKGEENWTREIHRVLSLELLQRQLIEGW
jgi:asparagine synthase (glutamine-hydrolysing)